MKTGRDSSLHAVLVAVAFVLLVGRVAGADTPVGGLISTDTHWTAAGTPYTVGTDIMIVNNATLTIGPGVDVRFAPDTEFKVKFGKVVARGSPAFPIRFTIDSDEPATYWRGIVFERDTVDASFDTEGNYIDGSILEHVIVEYTSRSSWSSGAISINFSAPFIAESLVQQSTVYGLFANAAHNLRLLNNTFTQNANGVLLAPDSDNVIMTGNHIIQNDGYGLHVASQGVVVSEDPDNPTSVFGNGDYDLYNDLSFRNDYTLGGPGNVDARNAWWGTTDPAAISLNIYDYMDDSSRGLVFYEPFVTIDPGRIVGDCDLSGCVDDDDLSLLLANWGVGTTWGTGDLDESGTVDDDDLSLLLANWGTGCSPAGEAVPEPATLSLLVLGGLALIRRRCK